MLNMMEEDCASDQSFVGSVLPHYISLAQQDPNTLIPQHEADRVIARAMHHHSEDMISWIGGEQKVARLVKTLESLKH